MTYKTTGYPSFCSPRLTITNEKFVDWIFSAKKDKTSQDHGERTLAGYANWESLKVNQTKIENNKIQSYTKEI